MLESLKNIVERLVVLSEKGIIREMDIPEYKIKKKEVEIKEDIKSLKDIRKEAEKKYIEQVLEKYEYNISQSAKVMDISRRQLFNKLTEYNLK